MEYGIQIASFAVILTIIIAFFQYERLPLMSTRLFTGFLLLALFNILAEFTTLYTIGHMEVVPAWLNRFCHQLFIGSLDLMMFCMFLYVDMKARIQKRYRIRQLLWRFLPAAAAFVMVVFGRLDYYVGEDGKYSYGPMAWTVYISVTIYMMLTLIRMWREQERFAVKEKRNLLYGIAIWLSIAIFQFFFPEKLMSSLGVALMVMFVYISFENPKEYQDRELPDMMNRYAFEVVLTELLERKVSFYVVSVTLINAELLENFFDSEELFGLFGADAAAVFNDRDRRTYHVTDHTVSTIFMKEKQYRKWLSDYEEKMAAFSGSKEEIRPRFCICVLECPRFAKTVGDIQATLEFEEERSREKGEEGLFLLDADFIEKKNDRIMVEKLLRKALQEDGLEVYYQPIFATKKKQFVSAEALVRLKDRETLGFISPEIFIPLAEKKGMIKDLGNQVFEKVCRFAAAHQLQKKGMSYIEVNLSGIQCMDPTLPETLEYYMKQYRISPGFINLEITETASVKAGKNLMGNLNRLRESGCHFSMDDFGTGYSNLSQMADINFDLIKLDKSLIWPCFEEDGKKARVILEACIEMIHNLGISIVAEGVENREQADLLIRHSVEYLQGYLYARPLPEAQFLKFMQEQ